MVQIFVAFYENVVVPCSLLLFAFMSLNLGSRTCHLTHYLTWWISSYLSVFCFFIVSDCQSKDYLEYISNENVNEGPSGFINSERLVNFYKIK